mmetsp:Transcript_39327/g.113818  ORF Transcript_39327/g.113818 Transcript_39327/m.113818 type:complete len:240 (-) Transcript_39327:58-777(-)
MPTLSVEYIKHETGEFDEESVFQAILSKRDISRIEAVNQCCNLRWLDLSRNQIIRIENLDGLSQLVSLDLSHNKIQKVQALDTLLNLERLQLKANPISRLQDLEGLRPLKKLRHLHFQNIDRTDFCPICLSPEYRGKVRELCPDLVALDSRRKHLPDLDGEVESVEKGGDLSLPSPAPWFTPDELDFDDVGRPEAVAEALKPQLDDFEAALRECRAAFAEAEGVLKAQEVAASNGGAAS